MNRIFAKCMAALCGVLTAGSLLVSTAFAEEAQEQGIVFPSGKTVRHLDIFADAMSNASDPEGGAHCAAFSVIVFQGDEIVFQRTMGDADISNHVHADENTVYEWGSVTKTTVWVSAMQLWEQGKLDLDADIRTYLPDGFFHNLQYDDKITMLNLMNHSAGWCENTLAIGTSDAAKIRPLGQVLQESEPAQVYRPGTRSSYSNWGAALAGYIVECISGESFSDYVHHHIFEPLGMEHTGILPDRSDNPWVQEARAKVKCYEYDIITGPKCIGDGLTYIEAYPCGAATGTIGDLAKYAQALADDSAPLFEKPETQEMLFSGSLFLGESDIAPIRHGFFAGERGVRVIGHNGATMGFTADMEIDMESKTGVITLCNESRSTDSDDIMTMVFGEELLSRIETAPSTPTPSLSGYYLNTRSFFHGPLKLGAYMTSADLSQNKDMQLEYIAEGCYVNRKTGTVFGTEIDENGNRILNFGGETIVADHLFVFRILLAALYLLAAVMSIFLLLGRQKLKKAGRAESYAGSAAVTLGRAAKIVSLLALTAAPAYYNYCYGVPKIICVIACAVQIICAVCCIAAAVVSLMRMLGKKTVPHQMLRSIAALGSNLAAVGAILAFEMYRFWGC